MDELEEGAVEVGSAGDAGGETDAAELYDGSSNGLGGGGGHVYLLMNSSIDSISFSSFPSFPSFSSFSSFPSFSCLTFSRTDNSL